MFPYKKVHIVGIGGSGMNGLANILLQMGVRVTGSDRQKNSPVDYLISKGVDFFEDHDTSVVGSTELIIATSAASPDHVILAAAREQKIPIWTRHDLLPVLLRDRFVIAVSGSHGKTTTTSLVKHILQTTGVDCGYMIGVPNPDKSGYWGSHRAFVIEADEYAKTFLCIKADVAIINNVDRDHADIYPTEEDYIAAFGEFVRLTTQNQGRLISNGDDPKAVNILAGTAHKNFGFAQVCDYRITNLEQKEVGIAFELALEGQTIRLKCPLHGRHNAYNVAAATVAVLQTGLVTIQQIQSSLLSFGSVPRRCEFRGQGKNGNLLIDDYAHAPEEIATTIRGLKAAYPNRKITAIWQPHTFSRVTAFEPQFVQACSLPDNLIIAPIYGAREEGKYDFAAFRSSLNSQTTFYAQSPQDILYRLEQTVGQNNLVIMLNAGDLNQMSGQILSVI